MSSSTYEDVLGQATARALASLRRPGAKGLRPGGPFRPTFWRSPLRGPWLTSMLGTLLLVPIVVVAVTGFISHSSYQPQLPGNSPIGDTGDVGSLFALPSWSPAWLYAVNQGLHVSLGLVAIPLLLAKLWSVLPRLFVWPPVQSAAMAVERASLLLLVGGSVFEFVTGVLNIQVFYPWQFNFVRAHYYGAWVFLGALTVHVLIKLPTLLRTFRERGFVRPLGEDLLRTRPEPPEPDGLVATQPATPTISRRGLLAVVGGASLTLLAVNLGETVGGPLRRFALLAPRGRVFGSGPNDFQVNKTAASAGVSAAASDPGWRLMVSARRSVRLSRFELMALPQRTYEITLGCVEGWSTTQRWTGVRLADLAKLVGAPPGAGVHIESLERHGPYRQVTLTPGQVGQDQSLLALCVNGVDLSFDHGYPARVIVPAVPGVHCLKWVQSLRFERV